MGLKGYLADRGFARRSIAEKAGISGATFCRYLQKDAPLKQEDIVKLAKVMRMTKEEVIENMFIDELKEILSDKVS